MIIHVAIYIYIFFYNEYLVFYNNYIHIYIASIIVYTPFPSIYIILYIAIQAILAS